MTKKQGIMCFLSGIFFLCMVSQVQAVPMTYAVNLSLNPGGGQLSGTIEIDSDNSPFGPVTNWNLLTSGGVDPLGNSVASMTWNMTTSSFITPGFNNIAFSRFNGGDRRLTLTWLPTLLNQPGPYTFQGLERYRYDQTFNTRFGSITVSRVGLRGGKNGTAVATPEPGTILLFGSGLLGLGLWRYRKNVNS